jgi:hypothetical protein
VRQKISDRCPALGVWVAFLKQPAVPGEAPQTKKIGQFLPHFMNLNQVLKKVGRRSSDLIFHESTFSGVSQISNDFFVHEICVKLSLSMM